MSILISHRALTQRFMKNWGTGACTTCYPTPTFPTATRGQSLGSRGQQGCSGFLDRDKFKRALLTHCNTPDHQARIRPAKTRVAVHQGEEGVYSGQKSHEAAG